MSSTLPGPYLVGKNCTVMGLAGMTQNSAGTTITAGTVANFLGKFDGFDATFTANSVEISAANASYENNVITKDSFTARIIEILAADGSSVLMTKYGSVDYFQATSQCAPVGGSGTAGPLLTVVGVRESCTYQVVEGKNVAVLTIKSCGVPPVFA